MLRRNRSVEAIEGLFDDHFGEIHRFAACRVGREAAADIAAETFEQALRSADRLDPERDARAWLFGIANNVIRHHRRAEERRLRAYAEVGRQPSTPSANGFASPMDYALGARLVEALLGVDARDREALLLYVWGDLSYDQIASALAVPLGTVRSRIHRARRAVREALESSDVVSSGHFAVVVGEETWPWTN